MKIVYTKHAKNKFNHPSVTKFNIERNNIKEAILRPDQYMENDELEVKIILRELNENYNLFAKIPLSQSGDVGEEKVSSLKSRNT